MSARQLVYSSEQKKWIRFIMRYLLGHIIGERKKYIIYGECYLSAIMHKKLEFGLKKLKKWIFTL